MWRFLVLFGFSWSLPLFALEQIRDVEILRDPTSSLRAQDLLQNPAGYIWEKQHNQFAVMSKIWQVTFLRFVLPMADTDSYVLHQPMVNAAADNRPYHTQTYVVDGDHLRELPFEDERFANYVIARADFGKTVVMELRSGPFAAAISVDLQIRSREEYRVKTRRDLLYFGFVTGIVAIMAIYNFGLLLLFRKLYLLYYTIYATAALYWFFVANGMLGLTPVLVLSFHLSAAIIQVTTVLFSFNVLNARQDFPRLHRWSYLFIAINLGLLVLVLLGFEKPVYLFYVNIPLSFLYCFILATRAAWNGDKSAYAMLLGWAGLFIGISFSTISVFINEWPTLEWAPAVAVSFEISTFSFAIGQKLRISELTFQRENTHAFGEMRKMIYAHQLERIRAGEHLEQTMPTHSSQAVVLSFDIIGSSKIKHLRTKDFFRRVFAQCNQIMSEGYNGTDLKANAYRIKEMGDGFLCSVGYPFAAMSANPAQDAVRLAKRFAEVLEEESKTLRVDEPIACGIGIARDSITGFYPEAGAMEYDLYGRAIVLAIRYEGMRKTLFDNDKGRSILILQEDVFQNLEAEDRAGFLALTLKERGVAVRDDPTASRVYYQFLSGAPAISETLVSAK